MTDRHTAELSSFEVSFGWHDNTRRGVVWRVLAESTDCSIRQSRFIAVGGERERGE